MKGPWLWDLPEVSLDTPNFPTFPEKETSESSEPEGKLRSFDSVAFDDEELA
jgi:hypothetical protein